MTRPKVKFCGITREQDAIFAEQLRVEFLGLIFAESARRVSIEKAKKIVDCLGPRIESIGVFVDEDIRTLIEVSDAVGLAGVQLHGRESSDYVIQIKKYRPHLKVIKAFEVDEHFDLAEIDCFECDYLLFDSPRKSSTRSTLNISILKPLRFKKPFFVAGGINSKNVPEFNGVLKPFAIDVSSGIEQSPGVKCLDKMNQLMSIISEEAL